MDPVLGGTEIYGADSEVSFHADGVKGSVSAASTVSLMRNFSASL